MKTYEHFSRDFQNRNEVSSLLMTSTLKSLDRSLASLTINGLGVKERAGHGINTTFRFANFDWANGLLSKVILSLYYKSRNRVYFPGRQIIILWFNLGTIGPVKNSLVKRVPHRPKTASFISFTNLASFASLVSAHIKR